MLFSGWEDKPQHPQTRKFKEIFTGLPFHSRVFINTLQMQAWKTSSPLWGGAGMTGDAWVHNSSITPKGLERIKSAAKGGGKAGEELRC